MLDNFLYASNVFLLIDVGNEGHEYVVALPDGQENSYEVYFASDLPATINVTSPYVGLYTQVKLPRPTSVPNVGSVHLDKHLVLAGFASHTYSMYLLINSSRDVTVHFAAFSQNSSGGFLALPPTAWSNEYYVVNFRQYSGRQLFVVVAQAKTTIRVRFKIDRGLVAYYNLRFQSGGSLILDLDPYEALQMRTGNDITGTKITSKGPIAVYSGAEMACFEQKNCGQLVTQLLPTKWWQSTYIIPPLFGQYHYSVRILAKENQTTVRIFNGSSGWSRVLAETEFHEVAGNNMSLVVIADKPISVIQLSTDKAAMILIPAMGQYRDKYTTTKPSPTNTHFTEHVSIIIETAQREYLYWTGSKVINTVSVPEPYSNYSIVVMETVKRGASFWHKRRGVKFGAVAFGSSGNAAYGLPLGIELSENSKYNLNHFLKSFEYNEYTFRGDN